MQSNTSNREQVALFVDLENFTGFCLALGLPLDLTQDLRRMTEHGRVVVRKSFGDIYKIPIEHTRKEEIRVMLQNNLIQHEDVRHINRYKNSSDIKLVIDALSIAYSNPTIDTFVVIADDRDYVPLFSKLREIGKTVIGIGSSKDSTKEYYRNACDHFYYHDSITGSNKSSDKQELDEFKTLYNDVTNNKNDSSSEDEVIALLIEAVKAVESKGNLPLGSMVAPMMRALKSDLDFKDYGLTNLKSVCEVAIKRGFITTSSYGNDMQITCIDTEIENYFEYQEEAGSPAIEKDDITYLIEQYKDFVLKKLKATIPTYNERSTIYQNIALNLKNYDNGIKMSELSKKMSMEPELKHVGQTSIYKVLYGLFRKRAFICGSSENHFDPLIIDTSVSEDDMDPAFVANLITTFRRDGKNIPFNSLAWSRYLYDTEDRSNEIFDTYHQFN
ncbi:MAG: NYN domain-containing protein [Pontibacterium sp.]